MKGGSNTNWHTHDEIYTGVTWKKRHKKQKWISQTAGFF